MKQFSLVTAAIVLSFLLTASLPAKLSLKNTGDITGAVQYDQKNSFGTLDLSNTLPGGFHDNSYGSQNQFYCIADGWATDPDDRSIDLNVRVLSDDVQIAEIIANNFRPDLEDAGECPGGTCGFVIDLWGLFSHDVDHSIAIQAQDAQTGEWTNLNETPKTLNCAETVHQPLIAANPVDDNISIYGLAIGTQVTIRIDDPSTFDIDFLQVATVNYAAWAVGDPTEIIAYFDLVNEFDLHSGQVIMASVGASTNTYTVTDFAITELNLAANTVAGIASPHSQIQFCVSTEMCRFTKADRLGLWTLPADDPETFILQRRLRGFASEYEGDYDNTYRFWTVPTVQKGYHPFSPIKK